MAICLSLDSPMACTNRFVPDSPEVWFFPDSPELWVVPDSPELWVASDSPEVWFVPDSPEVKHESVHLTYWKPPTLYSQDYPFSDKFLLCISFLLVRRMYGWR